MAKNSGAAIRAARPKPGSALSKLLDATRDIGMSGIIRVSVMAELAEAFALDHTPETADWARFLQAISQARRIM